MMRTNREMTLLEVHEESVSCITEPYEVPSLLWFSCPDNFLPYPAHGNFPLAGMKLTKVRPN